MHSGLLIFILVVVPLGIVALLKKWNSYTFRINTHNRQINQFDFGE